MTTTVVTKRIKGPSHLVTCSIGRVDWCDRVTYRLPPASPHEADYWRRQLFGGGDGRRSWLMRVRDAVVKPLDLKGGDQTWGTAAMRFPLIAERGNEQVVGLDDRHLDFRVGIAVRRDGASPILIVTTAVFLHNRLGRFYFNLIQLPHRVLVPYWIRRALEREARAHRE